MTKERQVRSTEEALELAREYVLTHSVDVGKLFLAIEEALMSLQDGAQPAVAEQHKQSTTCGEPVAWMFQHEETGRTMCVDAQQLEWGFEKGNPRLKKIAPLYTTPPQRKPLTDEQLMIALLHVDREAIRLPIGFIAFARAIEAAHGIMSDTDGKE